MRPADSPRVAGELRRWVELFGLTLAGAIAGGTLVAWYVAVYQAGDINTWLAGHL